MTRAANLTDDLGSHLEVDGRAAVRFERSYPHPIERVWQCITDPAELAHWFPSPQVSIQPRTGGVITFAGDPYQGDTMTGTVLQWNLPTNLAFSWGNDELRFELEATGTDSCRLVLIDLLEAANAAARNGGGWYVCLLELGKAISGRPGGGPHSDTVGIAWGEVYQAHIDAGLPHGAEVPD